VSVLLVWLAWRCLLSAACLCSEETTQIWTSCGDVTIV
jgi:hypothetical protein